MDFPLSTAEVNIVYDYHRPEGAGAARKDPATVVIVARGLVQMTAEKGADRRPPLWGRWTRSAMTSKCSRATRSLRCFWELNFDPDVGSPSRIPVRRSNARTTG